MMIPVEIESGPAKVVLSGSVFAFEQNPIVMHVAGLDLVFEFEDEFDDQGNLKTSFRKKMELLDQKTIKITFVNYNISTGIGTIEPFQIGLIENKRLFINYLVQGDRTRKSKLFHYTLYELENSDQEANKIETNVRI